MYRVIAFLALSLCLTLAGQAQGFEGSPFLEVFGGGMIPIGAANSSGFGFGPVVGAEVGAPIMESVMLSAQFSYSAPFLDKPNASSSLVGFAGVLRIPFSPDAATTGYFLGSVGGYQHKVSIKDLSETSQWRLGLAGGMGFMFAPEHWRSIYLDIQVRYQRIMFEGDGWEDVGILGGIGFHLM
jgi:hypothetical protein